MELKKLQLVRLMSAVHLLQLLQVCCDLPTAPRVAELAFEFEFEFEFDRHLIYPLQRPPPTVDRHLSPPSLSRVWI
jgi:hypothetical protein